MHAVGQLIPIEVREAMSEDILQQFLDAGLLDLGEEPEKWGADPESG
jgi:hypothetical protein